MIAKVAVITGCIVLAGCGAGSSNQDAPPKAVSESLAAANNPRCPNATPLATNGSAAADAAIAAAEAAIPRLYSKDEYKGYKIDEAVHAAPQPGDEVTAIPYGMCGASVGDGTWVVTARFAHGGNSNSLATGQMFVAQFSDGWRVWMQYH